ncbi:cytoskeleton associated protein, putative [Plasmodium ovale curtisi]|uniref:Cytoskeleton associated protein, putative n=1 Tax=Plasmodium ovale curtisi TaxID=864141 RepID=A0A1A8WRI7_PLAOA|nr:cytoskeleton associated protein, putative [Plasmodium ovale curtisi]
MQFFFHTYKKWRIRIFINIKVKIGTIRFIGQLKNHPNKHQTYYGIEWDNEYDGKNTGCFDNEFYFFPLHFIKKSNPNIYYKYNKDKHLIPRNVDDLKMYVKSFLCENTNNTVKPCSFMSLNNIHVGITFIQALNFRYNYFPDLDLSIEDYQTKKVKKVILRKGKLSIAITHDGRSIPYIHPEVKVNDTIRLDLESGKVLEHLKFQVGNMVMVTAGHSVGRVGTILSIDKNIGTYDIIHVKDSRGKVFATRLSNIFVIGDATKPYISIKREIYDLVDVCAYSMLVEKDHKFKVLNFFNKKIK